MGSNASKQHFQCEDDYRPNWNDGESAYNGWGRGGALGSSVHRVGMVTYRLVWKTESHCSPRALSVDPNTGSWQSREERPRSRVERAGVGRRRGAGNPAGGLHSPVKTWHLSDGGAERGWEGSLEMASAKDRTPLATRVRSSPCAQRAHATAESVVLIDASGKVLMSGRSGRVWCCHRGNAVSI